MANFSLGLDWLNEAGDVSAMLKEVDADCERAIAEASYHQLFDEPPQKTKPAPVETEKAPGTTSRFACVFDQELEDISQKDSHPQP